MSTLDLIEDLHHDEMMSKIVISSPVSFNHYRDYFLHFISKNQRKESFSHRSFAKKVGWPLSYLNDLVKGRKRLTVVRALQFARVFDLNPLYAEKLIQWIVNEELISHEPEKIFFENKVQLSKNEILKTIEFEQDAFEFTPELLSVCEVIQWKKGKVSPLGIKKLLYLYPDLSVEKIKRYLHVLEKKKVIQLIGKNQYEVKVKSFLWDGDVNLSSIQIEKLYHDNYVRWLEAPQGPARYSSGIIEVREEDVGLIKEKLDQLRNQLLALARKTAVQDDSSTIKTNLLQFGIYVFPIIDKTKA